MSAVFYQVYLPSAIVSPPALNGSVVHAKEFINDGLVIGSDEERALLNADKVAFPSYFGPHLLNGPYFI